MAQAAKGKAAPASGVSFGDLGLYTQGGGLPEGDYAWKDVTVQLYQAPPNQTTGKQSPARLGVMITLVPLTGGDERTQFYSMGGKAHESFAPNPDTGKGVVPVAGGPASTFNNSTNWAILLKSLRDSGLPEGIFTDDCSVLEGMHVHMANIPEPAERAGYQSKTGEAAEDRKPGQIAVVTEIKDDGKPWEGSGGVPEEVTPKGKGAPAANTQKATAKPAAAPVKAAPVTSGDDDDVQTAAINGVSTVLEKFPNGLLKIQLRTGTFKAVNESQGQEMAQSVISTHFASDTTLNALLGPLGYTVKGNDIKVA